MLFIGDNCSLCVGQVCCQYYREPYLSAKTLFGTHGRADGRTVTDGRSNKQETLGTQRVSRLQLASAIWRMELCKRV